jgi:hypothetical protein
MAAEVTTIGDVAPIPDNDVRSTTPDELRLA